MSPLHKFDLTASNTTTGIASGERELVTALAKIVGVGVHHYGTTHNGELASPKTANNDMIRSSSNYHLIIRHV
jgi:hypothetical protein